MSLTVFDLFAGCGGLSLGLLQASLDVRWANELDPFASKTYRQSHPAVQLFSESAAELIPRLRARERGLPRRGDVDLLAGGPPCQGFSGYNRHRSVSDPRNSLMETFLEFVDELRPPYVLIENVPGMLSLSHGRTAEVILETFDDLGYAARLGVVQAGYYGLPQNRWRVFVWAARKGSPLPAFPQPTHEFPRTTVFGATRFRECVIRAPTEQRGLFWDLQPTVTVSDAISDLPGIGNGGGVDDCAYPSGPQSSYQQELRKNSERLVDHVAVPLGGVQLRRCRAVPKRPGAGWLDLPDELKPRNLVRHGDERYHNRFGRLHWQGSFNTIVHKPEPYWGAVFHPAEDRVISVREAARAQGFPDLVHFAGSPRARYRQVGNAVPPPLARALGEELRRVARV